MLLAHLLQCLRLNQTLTLLFILAAALTTWLVAAGYLSALAPWQPMVWLLCSVVALGINTNLLRQLNPPFSATTKPSAIPAYRLEKLSVLSPLGVALLLGISYWLTGSAAVLPFLMLPILEAQLLNQGLLSKLLVAFSLGVLLLGLAAGFPRPMPSGMTAILVLLPFCITLMQFGGIIKLLVKNTSSQVIRLQSLAATDGLTGLINRRQFNHRLQTEIARAKRHKTPLTLALFDIDDFKKLNDQYGHPIGDRVLKELGALVSKNVRECDVAARYGGEEFALILPETRLMEGYEMLERLRRMVEQSVFCLPDNPIPLTVSIGVAQLHLKEQSAYELVEQADTALYQAKRQGKNQVVYGASPLPRSLEALSPLSPSKRSGSSL